MSDVPLAGRTAVVTGAAAGIGRATATRLARNGASVAVWDVDGEGAEEVATELRERGHRAVAATVDVGDRRAVDRAAAGTRDRLGPVHVLVNNAGVACLVPFLDLDEATWDRVFAVNVKGMFHCTQALVPDMVAARWGRIVNISSAAAQRGSGAMSAYAASKGAVISLTRSLAVELGPHGITVNTIPPNFIATGMQRETNGSDGDPDFVDPRLRETPVGRVGTPDDVAAACAFLASDDAGFITAQTFGVNGGRFP